MELLPFAIAWMELECIMLSEISQAVKDKYHMISPIVEPNEQNKRAKQNQRHGNKEQTDSDQRKGRRRG